MLIGDKIKTLRKNQKMKLKELAEKSGVQIATLSRIEHKKMTGTLASHMQIAKALGIEIAALYSDLPASPTPTPKAPTVSTLAETFSYNDKASYEVLAPNITTKKMLPVILTLKPGGRTTAEQNPTDAEKFIFVLEGEIKVQMGAETFPLKTKEAIYLKASVSHVIENVGKGPAKALAVTA